MNSEHFSLEFSETNCSFEVDLGEVYRVPNPGQAEYYDGSYIVTPKVEDQVLQTSDKLMSDDVTIKAIPFYSTSNQSGGETIYIGSEVITNG